MKKTLFSQKALIIIYFVLISVAAYILTPRFWEPGGETWRSWASARILRETGGFPVFSLSPGYVLYLLVFSLFEHPFSFHLEYFITHIFTYIALFLLLGRLLPRFFAFLFICAWIPYLAVLEGAATVAAIGFFALYVYSMLGSPPKEEYLPNSLLTASLCHTAYLPFLLGNLIGVFLKRSFSELPLFNFSSKLTWRKLFRLAIKMLLLSVFVLTMFFQSKRWDNNHMFIDQKYTPVSLKSILECSFFGNGAILYLEKIKPGAGLNEDWYFSKKEVWGDASTILEGIIKKPKVALTVWKINFSNFLQMPRQLFTEGDFKNPYGVALTAICFFLFILGIAGLLSSFKINEPSPFGYSIILGTCAVIATFMFLVLHFHKRYVPTLLPVWFLILISSGKELWILAVNLIRNGSIFKEKRKIIYPLLALILLIMILNKTTLSFLFNKELSAQITIFIWLLDVLLLSGVTLVTVFLIRYLHSLNPTVPPYSYILVICFSALFLLLVAKYPYGWKGQVKALLTNQGLMVRKDSVSLESAYPLFVKYINNQTRVLALEDIWIKAFTKADLDKVYNIFSLPPFPDLSGETQKMLSSLDEIWVSTDMTNPAPNYTTQTFLRYKLHLEPFLASSIKTHTWSVEEIAMFGKRYKKIKAPTITIPQF